MPRRAARRALAEKRPYLVLSIVAALAYYYLRWIQLPELYLIPIKGSACAFLAIYAWLRHGSRSARVLAGAMALASVADMAMEMDFRVGGALFFVFHCVMLSLLVRHKRGPLEGMDSLLFVALLLGLPALGWFLPYDRNLVWATALYGLALGAMAASAWASDFPRWSVGAGAILFALSDVVIFYGLSRLPYAELSGVLVWPVYYLGQLLITVGVITTLAKRHPELRVVQGGRETVH